MLVLTQEELREAWEKIEKCIEPHIDSSRYQWCPLCDTVDTHATDGEFQWCACDYDD